MVCVCMRMVLGSLLITANFSMKYAYSYFIQCIMCLLGKRNAKKSLPGVYDRLKRGTGLYLGTKEMRTKTKQNSISPNKIFKSWPF